MPLPNNGTSSWRCRSMSSISLAHQEQYDLTNEVHRHCQVNVQTTRWAWKSKTKQQEAPMLVSKRSCWQADAAKMNGASESKPTAFIKNLFACLLPQIVRYQATSCCICAPTSQYWYKAKPWQREEFMISSNAKACVGWYNYRVNPVATTIGLTKPHEHVCRQAVQDLEHH